MHATTPHCFANRGSPKNGKRRIIHIDDDHDMVATLAALLADLGHDVAFTTDSTKAVPLAQRFRPEIILMDIGMPKLDGYQLCRAFRAHPGFEDACIVAISAYGSDADRQKSRQAGFDAHVQKPVDLPVLSSILTQFGRSLERRAAPRYPAGPSPMQKDLIRIGALKRARDLAGGVSFLARHLGVGVNSLDAMIQGYKEIPASLFIDALDYIGKAEKAGAAPPGLPFNWEADVRDEDERP